jgi:hypothetical protein
VKESYHAVIAAHVADRAQACRAVFSRRLRRPDRPHDMRSSHWLVSPEPLSFSTSPSDLSLAGIKYLKHGVSVEDFLITGFRKGRSGSQRLSNYRLKKQRRNRTSTSNPERVTCAIEIAIRNFFVKDSKIMTTSTDGLKVKQFHQKQ